MDSKFSLNLCTVENYIPLADRILIELIPPKKETASGIQLPPGATVSLDKAIAPEYPYKAVVVKIGTGLVNNIKVDMEVDVGDIVYMESELDWNREAVSIDKKVYGSIRKSKIIGVIKVNK
jgi:co-chaperonin GroES (HSP10)